MLGWIESGKTAFEIAQRYVQTNINLAEGEMFVAPKLILNEEEQKSSRKPANKNGRPGVSPAPQTNVELVQKFRAVG